MAAAGLGTFGTPVTAAGAPHPSVTATETVTGDELRQVVQAVAADPNATNVMGSSWVADVRTAAVTGETRTASTTGGNEELTLHTVDTGRDEMVVKAARHELENGNVLTSAAFAIGGDRLLVYRSFDRLQNGLESKVELFDVTDTDGRRYPTISPGERSVNGSEPRAVSAVDTSDVSTSATCDDPCGGCHGAPPGDPDHGEFTDASCRESIDLVCVGDNCKDCTGYCTGGPIACAACLVLLCTFWSLVECCPEDPETQCIDCLSGSDGPCNEI